MIVRRLLVLLFCVLCLSVQAQVPYQLLMPSPLGMVITAGTWLFKDSKKIYYIEVEGRGATIQEARDNGFRLAVEQAIGTVIASETEVRQGRITRDEIISYAAGHVDHFEIASTTQASDVYRMRMRVWVAPSIMSQRLLVRSESAGKINGDQSAVVLDSINREYAQGDRMTDAVLRDWPKRSFDIELEPSAITQDEWRRTSLNITVVMTLNKIYADSVFEAMQIKRNQPIDSIRLGQLYQTLIGSEPKLEISILNYQNQPIQVQCYDVPELDHQVNYQVPNQFLVEFRGPYLLLNTRMHLHVPIKLPISSQSLANMQSVQARIVRKSDCK